MKAWYEATTLGGYDKRKKNNIMSHEQYIEDFGILDNHYQTDNIEGWSLSKEPTSLEELSNNFLSEVKRATRSYMQQVAFHAQLNVSKYTAQYPDIPEPNSDRKKTVKHVLVGPCFEG